MFMQNLFCIKHWLHVPPGYLPGPLGVLKKNKRQVCFGINSNCGILIKNILLQWDVQFMEIDCQEMCCQVQEMLGITGIKLCYHKTVSCSSHKVCTKIHRTVPVVFECSSTSLDQLYIQQIQYNMPQQVHRTGITAKFRRYCITLGQYTWLVHSHSSSLSPPFPFYPPSLVKQIWLWHSDSSKVIQGASWLSGMWTFSGSSWRH